MIATLISVYVISFMLVGLQGLFAWRDGYFSQNQMRAKGITNGYAFIEHGGMWSDVTIIPFVVGWIASQYQPNYFAWYGWLTLGISLAVSVGGAMAYQKMSVVTPEAHAHDGKTTVTGWIHVLYAVVAMWFCLMFFLTPVTPKAQARDLIIVAIAMSPFFWLGVKKFNPRWHASTADKILFIGLPLLMWMVVGLRTLVP